MENGHLYIVSFPIKHGDCPQLCQITRGLVHTVHSAIDFPKSQCTAYLLKQGLDVNLMQQHESCHLKMHTKNLLNLGPPSFTIQ